MSRAAVPAGTVRIGKGGLARLSPDLFVGERLELRNFDPKTRQLTLTFHDGDWGVRVYKAAPGAKSGVVGMMAILKLFGLQKFVGQTFRAAVKEKQLVINFKKAVYDGKVVA